MEEYPCAFGGKDRWRTYPDVVPVYNPLQFFILRGWHTGYWLEPHGINIEGSKASDYLNPIDPPAPAPPPGVVPPKQDWCGGTDCVSTVVAPAGVVRAQSMLGTPSLACYRAGPIINPLSWSVAGAATAGLWAGGLQSRPVRGPTTWTIARHDGPNHLGL